MKKNLVLSPKKYTRVKYITQFSTTLEDKIAIQELRLKIINILGRNIKYANVLGRVNIFCMRKNLDFYKIVFHPDIFLYAVDKENLEIIINSFKQTDKRKKFFNSVRASCINGESVLDIMKKNNLNMNNLRSRLRLGWELEKAICIPKKEG